MMIIQNAAAADSNDVDDDDDDVVYAGYSKDMSANDTTRTCLLRAGTV